MTVPVKALLRRTRRHRRGVAAMLFALLLPVLVGFVSLSVDTAVVATARAQLSTAADAASLAGARQLINESRVQGATDLSATVAAANTKASAFALANRVLGDGALVVPNPSNADGGDVMVGYLNPADPKSTLVTTQAAAPLFNSVQVTARRSADHGGLVPTFFGALMGYKGTTVTVQSTATASCYTIAGFRSINNRSANLLPIVLDVTTYNAMLAGTTTDQYTWDPATNAVTAGADGVTESRLYPVASGSPGNWGTIKVGVSNNSTAILSAQIRNGITPAELATFPGGTIRLDTSTIPPAITFSGNPGISAGIKDDLTSIIGQAVTIPIYDQSGGNGSNAWYRVVAFAPVRLLDVNFQGNPKYVVVQPALVTDPTAIRGTVLTSWKSGGLVYQHLSR